MWWLLLHTESPAPPYRAERAWSNGSALFSEGDS